MEVGARQINGDTACFVIVARYIEEALPCLQRSWSPCGDGSFY
jgi:hypothetical protein